MDNSKLIKAKEFYELTQDGVPKGEAAKRIGMSLRSIMSSDEYATIVSVGSAIEREKLKNEIEQVKRKQIKSYSKLLDKGEELMDEAETLQDKILAQKNHRDNLQTGVIESTIDWDGENRNQDDMNNILEGIVL